MAEWRDSALEGLSRRLLVEAGETALGERLAVVWNPRLRTSAGRALPGAAKVELNPKLGEFPEEIERTLRHELAHLVAQRRAGRRKIAPHGPEWRRACTELGIPGETATHRLPWERHRQRRRHAYRCPACGTTITRVRPLRRPSACHPCCETRNRGRYHEDFKLVKVPLPAP